MAQSKGRVKSQGIPVGVINRLPHYYRYLSSLMARDVERISSRELASKLGGYGIPDKTGPQLFWMFWSARIWLPGSGASGRDR